MKRYGNIIAIAALLAAIAGTVALSWGVTRCSSPSIEDADGAGEVATDPSSGPEPAHDADAGDETGVATDVRFEPLDYEALDAARTEALADAPALSADDPLVARLLGWAEVQGALEGSGRPALRASRGFELAATDLIGRHGVAGYAAVGELAWERFASAEQIAKPTPPTPLGAFEPADAPRLSGVLGAAAWNRTWRVVAWRTPFMPVARAEGLVDRDGQIAEGAWPLVRLLHRAMWARRGEPVVQMERVLSFEELLAFRRWQIEVSRGVPLERKLELTERAEALFDAHYHADRTRVILLLGAGRDDEASAAIDAGVARAEAAGRDDRAADLESLRPAR